MTKPCLITYETDPNHPGVARLFKSSKQWGWPLIMLHDDRWRGFSRKLKKVVEKCRELHADGEFTHVISIDARDSIVTGPPEEFISPSVPLLLATERNCWPKSELAVHFKDVGHPFKFAHSPFTIDLTRLDLLQVDHLPDWYDDQLFLTELYLNSSRQDVDLDYECKVVQSNAFCLPNWQEHFEIIGNRLINKYTGSKPLVQHCNGGTETGWWEPLL